jgi:hypothetical protein
VIITNARTIRIGARLLEEPWLEVVYAVGCLTNRSPSRQLDWKAPLDSLHLSLGTTNPRPNIAHLKIYGCRAYPLNPRIPRTKKLEPRAHIGYLVGYDSTNIFRIWIPSEERVVTTRDFTFQETVFYDSKESDLASQLRVLADQILDVIEVAYPPSLSNTSDIDTDSDDGEDSQERSPEQANDGSAPLNDSATPQSAEESKAKMEY